MLPYAAGRLTAGVAMTGRTIPAAGDGAYMHDRTCLTATATRRPSRLQRLPGVLKGLGRLWGQVAGGAVLLALVAGPWAPVMTVAALLTLLLPILALYLWGRALDEQMGWLDDRDDGPW